MAKKWQRFWLFHVALLGAAAFGVGLIAAVKRFERDGAGVLEAAKDERKRDNVDVDAEISAESLKTEALRDEFEETLARATAFFAEKTERPKQSEGSAQPEISLDGGEAERRR